ncbi:MAG: helix-turn-helix transcriptional regulator [Eubacteriales bacterium]|nr:helix-turn-helix transcriptional regulator [Eubacteriales bacterium]MDD4512969.1 helix-turn-helix transcriptional regulator [Eubacteriales bacterium]
MMSFSDKITILRKKSFLTQTEFAKELNVSFTTVNRWENGKAMPNLGAMKRTKAFCEETSFPYEEIENEWITHSSKE